MLLVCLSIDPSKLLYTLLHLFCLCFFIFFLFFIFSLNYLNMAPLFHMCFLLLVGFLLRVYDNVPFRSAVCATLCYKTIVCNRKQNLLTLTTINALNYLSNDLQNHHIIYILQILQIIIHYIPFIFHISYIIIFDFLIQLQCCLSYSLNDILVFFFV